MKKIKSLLSVLLMSALVVSCSQSIEDNLSEGGDSTESISTSSATVTESEIATAATEEMSATVTTPPRVSDFKTTPSIEAGGNVTIGLRADGTVVVGHSSPLRDYYDVQYWTDIVAVAGEIFNVVGLKSDGTVVYSGLERKVENFTDIIQISAEYDTIAGLKSDGTVVAMAVDYEEFDLDDWSDIIHVCAGHRFVLGIRADGKVLNFDEARGTVILGDWEGVTQISANQTYAIGVKADGTVVTTSSDKYISQAEKWTDIVQVSAGMVNAVGLKKDGTVVSTPIDPDFGYAQWGQDEVSDWTDIVHVSAGHWNTVGLKSDGTVLSVGDNRDGLNINDWNLHEYGEVPTSPQTSAPVYTTTPKSLVTGEKVSQRLLHKSENRDNAVTNVVLDIVAAGDVNETTVIRSEMGICWMSSDLLGLQGEPFGIYSVSDFDKAKIMFKIDPDKLECPFENLVFLYYDEEEQYYPMLETTFDFQNFTVSTEVDYLGKFMLTDRVLWEETWQLSYEQIMSAVRGR
ncbi:MAG: RCC1 domain-containing protein [Oscillospiraceae bacterium]|nr:RCC1 domain-containing protein [Oscillospiraceae bacterium]